jgi:hypothetical protein
MLRYGASAPTENKGVSYFLANIITRDSALTAGEGLLRVPHYTPLPPHRGPLETGNPLMPPIGYTTVPPPPRRILLCLA